MNAYTIHPILTIISQLNRSTKSKQIVDLVIQINGKHKISPMTTFFKLMLTTYHMLNFKILPLSKKITLSKSKTYH